MSQYIQDALENDNGNIRGEDLEFVMRVSTKLVPLNLFKNYDCLFLDFRLTFLTCYYLIFIQRFPARFSKAVDMEKIKFIKVKTPDGVIGDFEVSSSVEKGRNKRYNFYIYVCISIIVIYIYIYLKILHFVY